jgi:type IX secretion system PorP/SprF family membrane protein
MKWILTMLGVVLLGGSLWAQQPAQYTQYMLNRMAFNPAYAGMEESLHFTGVFREQWVGLPGNPSTQYAGVHMPLYLIGGGVGLQLENESIGAERHIHVSGNYSYQIPLGRDGRLSFGAQVGIRQITLDGSILLTPEGNYEGGIINHNDVLLGEGIVSGNSPTFGAGVYLQKGAWEFGVSALNLLESGLGLNDLEVIQDRTFFGFAGTQFQAGYRWVIRPSIMLKSNLEQLQVDFSVLSQYQDNFFLGASFRGYSPNSLDAVALIAGVQLSSQIRLFYSYDATLSTLQAVSTGSHEVSVHFLLGKPVGQGRYPGVIYNPRL